MNDQVKYLARLSASTALTLGKLYALAAVSTAASLFVSVLIMVVFAPDAGSGDPGPGLIAARPWHLLLTVLVLAGGVLLFILAGRYAMGKLVHRLLADKGEPLLQPYLDKAVEKFRASRPALVDRASSATMAKMRLVQEARNGSGNRWLRGALALAFKQARLDDVDFTDKGTRMGDVVRDRTLLALREMTRPGKGLILAVIAAQWLLVLAGWIIR